MGEIVLRAYQQKIIDDVRTLMRKGIRRILIVAPCGAGKTALTTFMLSNAEKKGLHSQFIVHRRELLKQSVEAFNNNKVKVGIIANGFIEDKRPLVQIASIYSLVRRFKKYPKPSLCYWDEAQYTGASSWESMMEAYPESYHVGLTATPCRLDGKGLGKYFDEMVVGPTTRELIDQGYLCDYDIYMPAKVDTSKVKMSMGDYNKEEIEALVNKPSIIGDVVKEYKKLSLNKKALVFCVSIKHSKEVVSYFNASGISAYHLDGETPQHIRDQKMREFERGEIKVISNVNLFSEGLNIPSIETVILLRPTASLAMYIQQVGRAMRIHPGKNKALIIDHVGNVSRHGLPCEDREWSLSGSMKLKRGEKSTVKVKTCDVCYAVQPPSVEMCKFCGNIFQKQYREVAEVDGELEQVDVQAARQQKIKLRKQEQGRAETLEDLIALGKKRGFRNPYKWAQYIHHARQAKKLKGIK